MRHDPVLKRLRAPSLFLCLASASLSHVPIVAVAQSTQAVIEAAAPLASVTVATVKPADMVGQVAISGSLVPQEEILIYPQVIGSTIDTLSVDVGDTVVAGQVLASLNDRTLTAQLAQARAEFARAQATVSQANSQIVSAKAVETQAATNLERANALRRNGTGTQAALDQATATQSTAAAAVASAQDGFAVAQAQQQQAHASQQIAELNLDRATLRAPADGLISARNGQVGAIAASGGDPIFRMIRDGRVEVEAEVIETALGSIEVGDAATLTIAGNGTVAGVVRRISPTVDARTRLGTIRIEILGEGQLRTGVFASGAIITEERRALAVPTTAVLTDASGTYVFVVNDGVLEKRAVGAGLIWNGLREIASGLTEDDVIVARAGAFFTAGDTINPIFSTVEGATQ
ncbi:efflux RND transporter periplasmic adaptor subunit [Celeribacter marinus]|uniref:efflux RND transporter periplasmic adaptor subunit n=1 Tax=Celeribacter marinus TaxID=1397108 RepID=UPI00316D3849